MNGSIYQITNLIDGKKYVGQTIQEPAIRRWQKHCYMARSGHKFPLYNATVGTKNPIYGKTHSKEAKNKMALARIGTKWSTEVRKKILDSRKKFYESKKLENI